MRRREGVLNQLLETLGLELSQGIVFDGVADFQGIAADLTVFDVAVTVNRRSRTIQISSPQKGQVRSVPRQVRYRNSLSHHK